jgi:enoyl-CoA hydratase/carnithine racemase
LRARFDAKLRFNQYQLSSIFNTRPLERKTMADFQFVKLTIQDHIAHLILNRPPVNALNRQLVNEILAVANLINREVDEKKARVVILSSAGQHFCAGADLKERKEIPEDQVEQVVRGIGGAIQAVAGIKVPAIAAVRGSALGGGMELALAADIRILSENAKMGLRETALAILPGAGGTQRLPRLIGYARALEWIATARIFEAQECLQYGVANRVVPDAELAGAALACARLIAANGPLAVQYAKAAMQNGLDQPLTAALDIEFDYYRRIIPTADRREALQAFGEKRTPVFRGE